ncbi:terpenoid cyclases/Protein prenyltransferase [Marasmius fiardii PR-910]|nr:terpenoid cyclases/Protein prenyltransferase [Marasmius fiardii PR-910]
MVKATPNDSFSTQTSLSQTETEEILLKHLPSPDSDVKPSLQRNNHLGFLVRNLSQGFPARYVSQDASQPWLVYWTLQSFSIMQVGMDPGNKRRAIDRILACQHPDGGFGGGPGHEAHLLPTYAAVCSLAIAGNPVENGGWDQIDRKKMYEFFMSLKQPDGSFTVSKLGEVDVRGIYCLLVVATLLNLLTPELVAGTPSFISSCQTYEGGFASASFPYYTSTPESPATLLSSPRPNLGEAHGGYTFCAVASWLLLQTFNRLQPKPSRINTRNLIRWLVQMQGTDAELGGFRGRTNKLVDGCYAWWVGGCFALLEGLDGFGEESGLHDVVQDDKLDDGEEWSDEDVDSDLWNAKALQEYVLYAGQHPAGGLRDKPHKHPDSYHTLYCLAGLSAAQHKMIPQTGHKKALEALWQSNSETSLTLKSDEEVGGKNVLDDDVRREVYTTALSWGEDFSKKREIIGGGENRLNATHPLFNLTVTHADAVMAYFYGQPAPPHRTPIVKK